MCRSANTLIHLLDGNAIAYTSVANGETAVIRHNLMTGAESPVARLPADPLATGLNCSSAAFQPGGASIACAAFGENPVLWSHGTSRTLPAPPVGWVGPDHLLLSSAQAGAQLFDVGSGTTQPVDVVAAWAVGAIPGGL